MVRISGFVDRLTYVKLLNLASERQQPVNELIADICKNFVSLGRPIN